MSEYVTQNGSLCSTPAPCPSPSPPLQYTKPHDATMRAQLHLCLQHGRQQRHDRKVRLFKGVASPRDSFALLSVPSHPHPRAVAAAFARHRGRQALAALRKGRASRRRCSPGRKDGGRPRGSHSPAIRFRSFFFSFRFSLPLPPLVSLSHTAYAL